LSQPLSQQLFLYCERGLLPGLWAEPINALTNAAYLVAAAVLWRRLGKVHIDARRRRVIGLLVGLIALVGIGSFAFHTLATRLA
jgi:hypothetical protein